MGGFDRAQFVIVPKSGKLVVHFLKSSEEVANNYHNTIFDHNNNLSHEALYARFAWALMKIVKEAELGPDFNFLEPEKRKKQEDTTKGASGQGDGDGNGGKGDGGDGDGDGGKWDGRGDGDDNDDIYGGKESDMDMSGTYQPGGSGQKKHALLLQPDSWLSDVLLKMAPGDNQSSLEADAHEIEEDLRKAARDHPFLGMCEVIVCKSMLMTPNPVDSTIEPTAHNYDQILWYPGMQLVERRKHAYLDSHPNIRAHSNLGMQSNSAMYDSV
jgi:hypothetical protein